LPIGEWSSGIFVGAVKAGVPFSSALKTRRVETKAISVPSKVDRRGIISEDFLDRFSGVIPAGISDPHESDSSAIARQDGEIDLLITVVIIGAGERTAVGRKSNARAVAADRGRVVADIEKNLVESAGSVTF